MVDRITSLGGSAHNAMTRSVDVLIATPHEMDIHTKKVSKAIDLEIPIVSEQWLTDCLNNLRRMPFQPYLLHQP